MAAAGLAGYIGWLLWGTGLTTTAAQHRLGQVGQQVIDTAIGQAPPPGYQPLPNSFYAQLIIPRIDLNMSVVEGTEYANLENGPGHYPDTADPWSNTGRVGIAGHRTTYLHPFFHLDQMQVGDPITLRTKYGDFTYRVTRVFTLPTAISGQVLTQTVQPTLVLTTCNPAYSATERLIVTADKVSGPSTP
jgi:sortase A